MDDFFEDDGNVPDNDILWRRFIICNEDFSEHSEAKWDNTKNLHVPTAAALQYKDDGMSSHSLIKITDSNLTMEDLVNNEDMPKKYICGLGTIPVGLFREKYTMRFREDPVVDEIIPLRGKCHILWGTRKLPPNNKEWRGLRLQFLVVIENNVLPINQHVKVKTPGYYDRD